jgi:DNA-binding MarR family transcriptional regulator
MENRDQTEIRALLDRVLRISAAEDWTEDISPSQRAVLSYLSRANRFSRAPSQVTDYLGATRGTVSQTLKTLARKGLVSERRSEIDKRSISYEISANGLTALKRRTTIDSALGQLADKSAKALTESLHEVMRHILKARDGRSFGICETCRYHRKDNGGAYCALLDEKLSAREFIEICHEHEATS